MLVILATIAIAWQSVSALGSVAALRRAPYTNEVVGNSATVSWATDRSQSTGSAKWGVVSGGQCTPSTTVTASRVSITVGSTSEYQWTAVLAFPGPGTYCYRVQLGSTDLLGT
ncbi:MAG: acid phosphatase type 7, partial [Thermoleophilaceae bacterium]|nr:acid phosphatase type 7 [Thermoleophilaceae bacterium]